MAELPTGTVTFLFTDLEGSTASWERDESAMRDALARHDALLRTAVAAHQGVVVKSTGDGLHAAFATARTAIDAALGALRVRMGLHTGTAEMRDGDYYGSAVNRAARLMAVAHGGQIVCSQATADLVRDEIGAGESLVDLGEHRLRDLASTERIFQVTDVCRDPRARAPRRRQRPRLHRLDRASLHGCRPLPVRPALAGARDGHGRRDARVVARHPARRRASAGTRLTQTQLRADGGLGFD
jgi:class 3 adenylate cyclase